jgi:hypothetical protein
MKSQINMMWNNMPCHHIIIIILKLHFCHNMPWQIYMLWKKLKFFFFLLDFVHNLFLTPFKHCFTCLRIHHDVYVLQITFVQDIFKCASIKDWTEDLMDTH